MHIFGAISQGAEENKSYSRVHMLHISGPVATGRVMFYLVRILFLIVFITTNICCDQEPDESTGHTNPMISSFSPESGTYGTSVTVYGVNFGNTISGVTVVFGDFQLQPSSVTPSSIVFSISEGIPPGEYRIIVKAGNSLAVSAQSFALYDYVEITDPEVLAFNYAIGTQTIGPSYGHTTDDRLIETAKVIWNMGSNTLKIALNTGSYNISGRSYNSLLSLVRDDPSFKYVFDMPFYYYFLWARSHSNWKDGYSEAERREDSLQIADLTKYLLTNYNNSGKKFFLGHWEGDWYLLDNYDPNFIPTDLRINGMIQWYRTRQNAVDEAKRIISYQNVEVYTYAEVNRVVDAMNGKKRVVNKVLPYTNVDYVSYSSYDSQMMNQNDYNNVLNFIEDNLPSRPGITGKRVFIGEMGRNAMDYGFNRNQHEQVNRDLIKKSLIWGAPYVLYWEMYNNEIRDGVQRGFWLIDDKNEKWPLYFTFSYFYQNAKSWVNHFKTDNHRLPSREEYLSWAVTSFKSD
jgi:hypothetical protein